MEARRRVDIAELQALPAGTFVGRGNELEKIEARLGSVRMITLSGPGGIGKTRLAAEAVRRIGRSKTSRARVYWVRLAWLAVDSEPSALIREMAHTVVGADFSHRPEWDTLVDTLSRNAHTILVLDNCEHVATSAARVAADLFERIPGLSVLATSRGPIGWIDEYLVPVPPLTREHALDLFRSRAELTGRPVVGAAQIEIAADICRHVHNHPLYIQLAAARLRHQPLAKILSGLTGRYDDSRLGWSHGFRSGADPRHRGVTDVIAWSYRLCTDEERVLFDRLSVFAVGYDTNPEDTTAPGADVGADLDAIHAICGDDPSESGSRPDGAVRPEQETEDLLERLVDHSLVSVHVTAEAARYSLVESLHAFAGQRLRDRSTATADEAARLAARHLHYYRDKITRAATDRNGPEGYDLRGWTRSSWHDIVTAIETGLTTGRADIGLEICVGLISLRAFVTSGSIWEMRRWTQRCLDASYALTPELTKLQIDALTGNSWLALTQGLPDDAAQMLDECV
ncbi:ATP-binding protein, partial [Nocardia sp. NPDC003345]